RVLARRGDKLSVKAMSVCYSFMFFFSSRRRHTISKRDWSSDVCSSDLQASAITRRWTYDVDRPDVITTENLLAIDVRAVHVRRRSEERRVGKESRSGWVPYRYETSADGDLCPGQ